MTVKTDKSTRKATLSYMRPYLRKQTKFQRKTWQKVLQDTCPSSQFPTSVNFTFPVSSSTGGLHSQTHVTSSHRWQQWPHALVHNLLPFVDLSVSLSLCIFLCVCVCVCVYVCMSIREKQGFSVSPVYPTTCSVAQGSLPWTPICLHCHWVLGLKACTTTGLPVLFLLI